MPNHPMVETLVSLARADLAIVHAKKRKKALTAEKNLLAKNIRLAEVAVDDAQNHLSDLKHKEIQMQRDIENYQKRKKTAVFALETGAGNPDSATRQIQQCSDIIDELEYKLLENMDAQDAGAKSLDNARHTVSTHGDTSATFRVESEITLTNLNAIISAQSASRNTIIKGLDVTIQNRYEQLRRAKGTSVARVIDKCCRTCQLALPMQDFSDLQRG